MMMMHPFTGTPISIAATATAVPPHTLTREDVKTYMPRVFNVSARRLEVMMSVIDHAEVDTRQAVLPVDDIVKPRSLTERAAEYQDHAVRLGREAAEKCLTNAGMTPSDVDLIVTISCTGFMIPSLDAHLINLMGFHSNVRRLPITELGCVAGAMALSRASEFVRAFPDATVLIVSVELPTLTFQRDDVSQANLISCVLFGDGAAAALVTGRPSMGPGILGAETYTFPASIDAMGFNLRDSGFHIVLSKEIPHMIRRKVRGLVDDFLTARGLSLDQIAAFILHPGGRKVLSSMEEELGLQQCDTQFSHDVLRRFGNLSSATVLFILHEWLTRKPLTSGDYGLLAAFGPGFSAELMLLRWP